MTTKATRVRRLARPGVALAEPSVLPRFSSPNSGEVIPTNSLVPTSTKTSPVPSTGRTHARRLRFTMTIVTHTSSDPSVALRRRATRLQITNDHMPLADDDTFLRRQGKSDLQVQCHPGPNNRQYSLLRAICELAKIPSVQVPVFPRYGLPEYSSSILDEFQKCKEYNGPNSHIQCQWIK